MSFYARSDAMISTTGQLATAGGSSRNELFVKVNSGAAACLIGLNAATQGQYGTNWFVCILVSDNVDAARLTSDIWLKEYQYNGKTYYANYECTGLYGGWDGTYQNPHGFPVIQDTPIFTLNTYLSQAQFEYIADTLQLSSEAGYNLEVLWHSPYRTAPYSTYFEINVTKNASTITVNPSTVNLSIASGTAATVSVSTNSDGTLSAVSNNTSIATVTSGSRSLSILPGSTTGTTTITVTIAASSLYEGATATVTVNTAA